MSLPLRCLGLAVLPLLAGACVTGDRPVPVSSVRDSAGIRIVDNRPEQSADSCSFSPALSIGVVEGDERYQLFRVMDATRLSDGRIAVVNQGSDEIRVYDAGGTYLHAFGRAGGGPGEFRDVFQIIPGPGDTLVVGDYRPWRFSYFTAEGEYVRTVEPDPPFINTPQVIGVMADGGYVLGRGSRVSGETGFQPRSLHLERYGSTGELIDTLGVYSTGRYGLLSVENSFAGSPVFEPSASAEAAGDNVVVGLGSERELHVLDIEGRVQTVIRWTGPDRSVGPGEVELFRAGVLDRYRDNPDMLRRFGLPQVSENRPVNDRFPAHQAVLLGRAGDLWVREYPRPSWGEDDDRWMVFGLDGTFVCHARTPAALRYVWDIYEIGDDYLLGNVRDAADVEHVQLYRLTRP